MTRAKTKDEKFMIAVYEAVKEEEGKVVDRYEIGTSIGLQARGVNATCNLLFQANFLKKMSATEVTLTERGKRLVLDLLEE
ncbi:MAG: hypothetical protein CK425_07810 [Parachlamydia sp.]|jgi:Mn-dependent DtxR family transcriptional regulator|nr:MAG: hypothetical protein CK425_07810 [Parachlamydia sp.]